MPSAVFISVSGRFFFSVTVCLPPSMEPPAIAILAAVFVRETRRNVGFEAGNLAPTATLSVTPLIEMSAELAFAAVTPEVGVVFPEVVGLVGFPVPEGSSVPEVPQPRESLNHIRPLRP